MPLAELLGQDGARARLQRQLVAGRLPQALIFAGPPGVGKTMAARLLAGVLCCRQPRDGDACGQCSACLQNQRRRHPDVLILAPENRQLKIEQVAEALDFISRMPVVAKRRVVIFSQAESLNQYAANALLKTLEEPLPGNYFILVSSRHQSLPATILSRCQLLVFQLLTTEAVARILAGIEVEGEVFSESVCHEAAAWSGGNVRRGTFFLDPARRAWSRQLLDGFASLPGSSLAAAYDLAEMVAGADCGEEVFFILQGLLHDAQLAAAGARPAAASAWSNESLRLAVLGSLRLGGFARELAAIERDLRVNINLKIALEAFFLDLTQV